MAKDDSDAKITHWRGLNFKKNEKKGEKGRLRGENDPLG